ncbi:MAG: immunoglobulin domain-containing protein [Phycisphaerae bacterium]
MPPEGQRAATAISGHPQPQAIALNGTAVFTVTATGEGPLVYQWQRNGSDLADGGHYSGTATATLTVSNAGGSDAGSYRCVVTGGCGPAISNAAALTVGAPGDLDGDGDVDLDDFGLLQACMDATTIRPADPRCADANLDKDPFGAVTQADLAIFRKCLTGAEKPADPACAN